ncbi:MAG: hypothetical protein MR485_06405 [Mollicutes bacterium]|nr:hypothetical protein [Mollicutes bacterium]
MKYYRIDDSKMFYRRKYAYLSANKDNEAREDEKFIRYEKYQCPHCGDKNMWYFYPETFVAVFSTDSVGDFSFGIRGYGNISFSEKALKAFEKYKIKGIKDVKKYNKMETTRYKPITSITGDYYASTIDFETLILYNCKDLGTTKIDETLGYTTNCTKCIAGKVKNLWDLDPKTKIYYTGLKDIDNDIFSIYSNPSIIFVSERFREMCIKENLTNILDKLVEVFDESEYE